MPQVITTDSMYMQFPKLADHHSQVELEALADQTSSAVVEDVLRQLARLGEKDL